MTSHGESSAVLMQRLRQKFISRLELRANEFELAIARAQGGDLKLALADISRLAHSLKGASCQFEFDDLALIAEKLEFKAGFKGLPSDVQPQVLLDIIKDTQHIVNICRQLSNC